MLVVIEIQVDFGVNTMKKKIYDTLDLSCSTKVIEKLDPLKQQIYCLIDYTKIELIPLYTEQENIAASQSVKERSKKQKVSSKQKFQDELGYLVLSLLQCDTDDEKDKHLHFIETTLRRYIQLVEKS